MKKILSVLLLLVTFAYASVIKDQLNREVVLSDKVDRIVVLQHQSLNVLVQIGAKDKIVGVLQSWEKRLGSDYKRLFNGIDKLPTPGDLKTVNFESILNLKPDVVIVTNYIDKSYIEKLEELKIPVVMMSFFKDSSAGKDSVNPEFEDEEYSYDNGLYEGIMLLGKISDKEDNAKELVNYIKNSQNELKEYTKNIKDKIKLYMANPKYQTYGSGKYTSIIFKRAGGENVAAKDIKGYKQVSAEKILSWNPDIIFVQARYSSVVDELKNDKSLKNLDAIKNNKIYLMPEYAKAWGYPTPEAMSIGEFWIAKKLYPDIFKDFDLDKKVKEYYKKFYQFEYDGK
ncbi:ABC transporter substrate-binding protein [Campylobacter ureolyticus]|uniref:ABC transporter substrate-binding protein n=1 Tax=Campylobacter ureolyticus TaxID=827 RepID=A0A9Q4PV85_9BACT|nr:ABC transporter substrate-binding protein [Campylobacter ureolyticus]MCZ6103699.1 ABC transporter substrate-binding protein [Campylobacter ureolyticus]MCZ6133878.1 ABC transporter substrate-binding protein [Campylobacter ureolyticus]MCZ6161619.1 ABC transporter substrate-binding protein [Campylobacter ureolyticus]MCZ6170792.1 ABC transporter substrate-binding protein [Campylobacter ureolyticus]MDU4982168.1 ABC transporter substrate-binding protein [Campylobacter ureolyticus]